MNWSPDRYLGFHDLRLRPALDLMGRISMTPPRTIVDLGCGPGNVSALLLQRWPDADLTGVDQSTEMLERARAEIPRAQWVEADISCWYPDVPVDLLFSNAALHWVGDHPALFARLAAMLGAEGVLAVQMPANFSAPSHRLIRELAASSEWAGVFEGVRMGEVLEPDAYQSLLSAHFGEVDLWETSYYQRLSGEHAVFEWLAGSTLVPYFDRLSEAQTRAFVSRLKPMLASAYPVRPDGSVLFPFKRLFMLARGPVHRVPRETC
ncbi:trans-aconitate 2-methyltransferase [Parazoarcus communis]|uniref:Trans-aconitate 2-methyltransferase n=1 Tax=Parazoarcus communis TaxID=41977 RepID=A0A2U8GYQ7_9RHOO|nr:trans-aconitate 2-methyltransferase [Parazoarcus communis]